METDIVLYNNIIPIEQNAKSLWGSWDSPAIFKSFTTGYFGIVPGGPRFCMCLFAKKKTCLKMSSMSNQREKSQENHPVGKVWTHETATTVTDTLLLCF